MAGDRTEPGLGKPDPDKDADKTNPQDDFLDLIPERLVPQSRATDDPEFDGPPLSVESAATSEAAPRSEISRAARDDENDDGDPDDEDDVRSGGSKGVMAAVVIGAVAAGIAGWYLFLREDQPQVAATTPVITGDSQPYKVKPADPGGMDVPDTDKMVYDRLGQNTEGGGVENLLPEPEMPTAPPVPADAGGMLEPQPEEEIAATPEPAPVSEAPAGGAPVQAEEPAEAPVQAQAQSRPTTPTIKPEAPAAPTQQAAAPAPSSTPEHAATDTAPAEPQAPTPAPTAPKSTAASAPSGGGGSQMIQLAALRDQAGAEAAWKQIQAANSDLLGNLSLDVQRADLGDKGIFYRVRAKGLASADEAKALCEKLKERGQGCLVVR